MILFPLALILNKYDAMIAVIYIYCCISVNTLMTSQSRPQNIAKRAIGFKGEKCFGNSKKEMVDFKNLLLAEPRTAVKNKESAF